MRASLGLLKDGCKQLSCDRDVVLPVLRAWTDMVWKLLQQPASWCCAEVSSLTGQTETPVVTGVVAWCHLHEHRNTVEQLICHCAAVDTSMCSNEKTAQIKAICIELAQSPRARLPTASPTFLLHNRQLGDSWQSYLVPAATAACTAQAIAELSGCSPHGQQSQPGSLIEPSPCLHQAQQLLSCSA
jgi:hypothetical protein